MIGSNETVHKVFEPTNHNFGDDLINDITKANRPKMRNLIREKNFGDEGYESMIERFKKRSRVKKGLDSVNDIHLHNTPKFLKKKAGRPSGPGALCEPSWKIVFSISAGVMGLFRRILC